MSTNFGQGDGTLIRAAGMVAEAKADLLQISNQLNGRLSGYQSQFVGQGGASFFALNQAWTQAQTRIVNALDGFSESLTATERDNVSTDEAQSTSFTNLTSRLG